MPKKRKSNISAFFTWVKEQVFGRSEEDIRYMLIVYAIATVLFIFLIFPISAFAAAATGHRLSILAIFGLYIAVLFGLRLAIHVIKGTRAIYAGDDSERERGGDDFSEIEALVSRGQYAEAIERYKQEYEEREGEDERPRIRIAEIYWTEMKDYAAAASQYGLIARTTRDQQLKLDMYTKMLELYRDHIPDHPGFKPICKKVLDEFPGTLAAKIAYRHLSQSGG